MRRAAATLAAALLLAGCGGDDGGSGDKDAPERDQASTQAEQKLDPKDLAGRWWQWAGKRRDSRSPVTDETGERCEQDQPGDVFFLAGTYGGRARRTCTVPAGRPIFLPVLNQTCPVQGDAAVAAEECQHEFGGAKPHLRVDGRAVKPVFVVSPPYRHDPHPDSSAGVAGESVAAGYHALLDPLPPGEHTISFGGSRGESFSLDVRYELTVE